MNSIRRCMPFLCLLIIAGATLPVQAQWDTNGTVICAAPNDQYDIELVSDGSGGAVLVWRDQRTGSADIYCQRIDAGGMNLWAHDGAAICTASGDQVAPKLLGDGTGGAILGWSDSRLSDPTSELYIQRISDAGAIQWTYDGRWINYGASLYDIVSDGADGAFLVWSEAATYPVSVAVQRINPSGYRMWEDYTGAGPGYNMSAVSDGNGGLVAGWQSWWSPSYRNVVHGQRLDSSGNLLWPSDQVSPGNGCDFESDIASDGAGGGIWAYRQGGSVITQRVDAAGTLLWGAGGVNPLPNLVLYTSDTPQVVSDGAGGALVVVVSDQYDIHMNRILADGTLAWTDNGVTICNAPAAQIEPRLAPDGLGGAYVVWRDSRDNATTGADVYAEHIDAAGNLLWGGNGIAICTETGNQGGIRITAAANNGAVIAWSDARNGNTNLDVYAQAIHLDGTIGDPPIRTTAVAPPPHFVGAPTDGDVLVTFGSAAAPGTDWAGSVFVHGSQSGLHAGVFSYDTAARTMTFDPTADFAAGEVVQVMLTAGIGTVTGYALEPQMWSFTTATQPKGAQFEAASSVAVGDGPSAVCAADLDGDGVMDLAVANSITNSLSVLLGNGDGTFAPEVQYTDVDPEEIVAGDIDYDGDLDLVATDYDDDLVVVLRNLGSGTFAAAVSYTIGTTPFQGGGPGDLTLGDFEGDGDLDVVTANRRTNDISILTNNGDGTFVHFDNSEGGDYIASGDLDGDGSLDLLIGGFDTVPIIRLNGSRWVNFDHPHFGNGITFGGVGSNFDVELADLDNDGDLDIVAVVNARRTDIHYNLGNWTFDGPHVYPQGRYATRCVVNDVDGDGFLDLIQQDTDGSALWVRLNDGAGAFGDSTVVAVGTYPSGLASADLDGDGAPDLISVSNPQDEVSILLNRDFISAVPGDGPPAVTQLVRNVPNPFNPATRIDFSLKNPGPVHLTVFDHRGARVRTLVDGFLADGPHDVMWGGRDDAGRRVASGVYFYRLQTDEYDQTRKMVLVK